MKSLACLVIAACLFLAGCAATMQNTVQARAAFDFNCSSESLKISELHPRTYGVEGCGKRATYLLDGECSIASTCKAVLNSPIGKNTQ